MDINTIKLKELIDNVTNQTGKLRRGGLEVCYFCTCGHYKRKLEVSLELFIFHCWVCQNSGNIFKLLKIFNATPSQYSELKNILGENYKTYKKSPIKNEETLCLPEDFISLLDPPQSKSIYFDEIREYHRALNYLKRRGIGIEEIGRYNIGYCINGEYKDCIIIPSYDANGKLNYFSARSYYPKNSFKYHNAPFSKDIIGFESFINYDQPITLVEGCFDAIAVRNNAIPLFGTSLSKKLMESLVYNNIKKINVALDKDAMAKSINIIEEIKNIGDIEVHLIKLDKKDPSDVGFDKMHDLINESGSYEFKNMVYDKLYF